MKRTRWFTATKHKPVRPGVYEYWDEFWGRLYRARWTGRQWVHITSRGVELPVCFGDRWRGVEKP